MGTARPKTGGTILPAGERTNPLLFPGPHQVGADIIAAGIIPAVVEGMRLFDALRTIISRSEIVSAPARHLLPRLRHLRHVPVSA